MFSCIKGNLGYALAITTQQNNIPFYSETCKVQGRRSSLLIFSYRNVIVLEGSDVDVEVDPALKQVPSYITF